MDNTGPLRTAAEKTPRLSWPPTQALLPGKPQSSHSPAESQEPGYTGSAHAQTSPDRKCRTFLLFLGCLPSYKERAGPLDP